MKHTYRMKRSHRATQKTRKQRGGAIFSSAQIDQMATACEKLLDDYSKFKYLTMKQFELLDANYLTKNLQGIVDMDTASIQTAPHLEAQLGWSYTKLLQELPNQLNPIQTALNQMIRFVAELPTIKAAPPASN
jgi:hypothetical protein